MHVAKTSPAVVGDGIGRSKGGLHLNKAQLQCIHS